LSLSVKVEEVPSIVSEKFSVTLFKLFWKLGEVKENRIANGKIKQINTTIWKNSFLKLSWFQVPRTKNGSTSMIANQAPLAIVIVNNPTNNNNKIRDKLEIINFRISEKNLFLIVPTCPIICLLNFKFNFGLRYIIKQTKIGKNNIPAKYKGSWAVECTLGKPKTALV